jgi:hypothetical protein
MAKNHPALKLPRVAGSWVVHPNFPINALRYPRFRRFWVLGVFAFIVGACDWFDFPLDEFHAEQTGTVTLGAVLPAANMVAVGCILRMVAALP